MGWVRIRRGWAGLEVGKEVGWVRRRRGRQDWTGAGSARVRMRRGWLE